MNVVTETGTCYNNCKIQIHLVDSVGQPLDISGTDLDDVKYYVIEEHSSDTSLSFSNEFFVRASTYKAGVQAVCKYVRGVGDTIYTRIDTATTVTTTTTYVTPTLSVVSHVPNTPTDIGTVPTLPCENTGRVQLNIRGGFFPYIVEVRDEHQNPIDTVVFSGRMYAGEDEDRYDYKDYYSIEGLAAGKYYFLVSDGCAYVMPLVNETITTVESPYVGTVCWHSNSGNPADSNVTKIELRIITIPGFYATRIPECVEYRIIYPEFDGIIDTTQWKHPQGPFTDGGTQFVSCIVYDTAWRARSYCDIRGLFKIETRTRECETYVHAQTFERTLNGYDYAPSYGYGYGIDSTVVTPASADCEREWGRAEATYQSLAYLNVTSNYNFQNLNSTCESGSFSDRRYTAPLTWIYTTDSGDTVKTMPYLDERNYTIRRRDLLPFFDPDTISSVRIKGTLVDGKNCQITQVNGTFELLQRITNSASQVYPRGYVGGVRYDDNPQLQRPSSSCYQHSTMLTVGAKVDIPLELNDGCTIELIESPYNNHYNFTAHYDHASRRWTVTKENPENLAELTFYNNRTISILDYGMPSGFWVFRTTIPCAETRLDTIVNYTSYYERRFISETPQYELTTECTEMLVKPVAGAYTKRSPVLWRGEATNVGRDSVDAPEVAYFRIISGPAGGYQNTQVRLNRTLRVTRPGTYVVRMYNSYCSELYMDDTLYFSGGTVEHEYDIAYTCNAESTEGFVRAKSINGTAPYTYNLYSGPDMTGTLLASNQTGRFDLMPIRSGQVISVESIDQCLASFYVNVTVHDLENLHKCWIGGGVYAAEECEGSLVHLHSLNFGDDVTYRWEGPDGFASTARDTSFYLQRGASGGTYRIQFSGTGCGIVEDSVSLQVKPAPSVHIADDTEFCPGDTVTLTYTAGGVGDVHYTIGHQQPSGTTFQNYTNSSGHSYVPYTNGIFWVHSVQDDNCTYTHPEDTVHVSLRSRYASACMVSPFPDSVCPGNNAVVHAQSVLTPPYTLNWYADAGQENLLKSEEVLSAADYGSFGFSGLIRDTAVYVTAHNNEYCETSPQFIHLQKNMSAGHTSLECGKAMLFYDSGGSGGDYHTGENVSHTFFSPDGNSITVSFNSFSVTAPDKLLVYTGETIHPDSLLTVLTGNLNTSLPAPIVSNGNSMTLWFLSNANGNAAGWEALIRSHTDPAIANAKVLDSVRVEIAPVTPVPVHYNGDVTLQAAASGGRGIRYQYTWATSTDEVTWANALVETTDTSRMALHHLTQSTWVRVAVADRSPDACDEKDTFIYFIPISDIRLSLTLEIDSAPPCSETRTGRLTVRNSGSGNASDVTARVMLPANSIFADTNDGRFNLGDISAGDSVSAIFQLRLSPYPTVSTDFTAKAQIWSCQHGDAAADVFWGDWDWTGLPRQADEDTAKFSSLPYSDALPAPVVFHDTVCYMQTSVVSAKAIEGMPFPQYLNWYSDEGLLHHLKTDTLYTATEKSRFTRQNVEESTVLYLTSGSDGYCLANTTPIQSMFRQQTFHPATAFNDTVCFGSTATLSASSELDFPQYYEWWNASFDSVVFRDTIASGNMSRFNIARLTTDTFAYVTVSNQTTCPYIPEAFRRRATEDFLLDEQKNRDSTFVSYMDSIPFYDDGGPDGYTVMRNRSCTHTFVAVEGAQVVLNLDYFDGYGRTYMIIYDGGSNGGSQIGYITTSNFTHSSQIYTSTSGRLTVQFYTNNISRGWAGSITTDNASPEKAFAAILPALDTTFFLYSTCPDTVLLSYEGFNNIDISVPGEYVIDSVFTAANGCDSVVRLLLTVTDPSTGLSCPDTVVRGLADGETYVLITGSELGMPTTSFTPDTLFNNAPSDGRYPLGDHTVTWSAVNECGDTVTCTQCVRVLPPCNDAVDFEGNVYPAIRIGCQCWTQTNIRSAFYSDGTPVASYSSYNGSDSLRNLYGYLYSWYSVARVPENDDLAEPLLSTDGSRTFVQGICPEGWGVPTVEDFEILYFNAGERLALVKEADTRFWVPDTEGATPNSGFNARGGGIYNAALGRYESLMTSAAFWAVDITRNPASTSVVMPAFCDMETDPQQKNYGLSIRCVKNYCGE